MMPFNSIRTRMTLAFAGSVALLTLSACGGISWYARRAAERGADSLLQAIQRKIEADQSHDAQGYADLMHDMEDDLHPNGLVLFILNPHGQVVAQSQRQIPFQAVRYHHSWHRITRMIGPDIAILGLPWGRTEHELQAQAVRLFGLGLLITLAATAGAWLLVGKTLSPIDSLSRQAHAASVENLRVNLIAPSRDAEIVRLVSTLNGLLGRVGEAAAARGRFQAAASHELRTPLQALSGHLELALTRDRTASEYQAVVVEACAQTRRLISLTRDLLLLNQIEAAQPPQSERVFLAEICDRAVAALEPIRRANGLTIDDCFEDPDLIAPPTHAEMLVRNLIENAVKYAEPGSVVRVSVVSAEQGVYLEVFNSCPPLSEPNLAKLFEPFYRPDASRNSKTGGAGLGLAVCKAIAQANGWNLALAYQNHGVLASVLFPSHR